MEEGHLILNRNLYEEVVIGDDIRVGILGVQGRQVRLRISAPKNVSIHRTEVYERIQQEKEEV
jgi:carbon storage regulator